MARSDRSPRRAGATTPPEGPGRSVTSYDVARHAGVSQSAVSRFFTPGASVSARMRARIQKAADDLGYKPSAIARILNNKRSNLVAVIVANLGFNPEFTSTLSREIAARGLNLLFFTLDDEGDVERVIDQIRQYRVDGVLSAAGLPERQVRALIERGVPVVFLNRGAETSGANSVCCDQEDGERLLVDRLAAAGHRTFGIVTGPAESPVSRQRVDAAARRLASRGLPAPALAYGDFTYEGGRRAMRALAADGTAPDAIICANDLMAIGCIDEARTALGLAVPEQVSVVGFDGSAPGRWAAYDLTTIRQPTQTMMVAALDLLEARLDDPERAAEKRMFAGELVLGGSARLA